MPSSASGKYDYNIERLKFRNRAAIKIPKSGAPNILNRETCYKLAIDVIIESVTKPEYRNLQTTPYHGFYGYATLVMRDCIAPKIQLQFGRNRIFEQRIVEAFQGWNELAFYLQTTKRFLESIANSLRTGNPPSTLVNLCDIPAFTVLWSEIDLREVYVLCPEQTQFRIELSWVSPKKFTDDCGKEQDGKSKEPDDPKKDGGLPPNGTQPKKNAANNPFGGNTPFTPISADSPYFNPKGGDLNNTNPENSGGGLFWIEFRAPRKAASFNPSCSTKYSLVIIPIPTENHPYILNYQEMGIDNCGANSYGIYTFTSSISGAILGNAGYLDAFGGVITYHSGTAYPSTIYYSITQV